MLLTELNIYINSAENILLSLRLELSHKDNRIIASGSGGRLLNLCRSNTYGFQVT